MFALPEAKRVRRADLHSPTSSRASSPAPETLEFFRSRALSFTDETFTAPVPAAADDDSEAEFNLFARPAGTTTVIKIRSPTPESIDDTIPPRPESYYIRGALSQTEAEQFAAAALSGDDIFRLAKIPWPGSRYAWKVTTLPSSQERAHSKGDTATKDSTKRKRMGKKGRIKLRIKMAATKELREKEEAAKAEKELADRQKRAKKNREKKARQRQRDKLKKAAEEGGETADAAGDANEQSVGGSDAE